MRIFLVSIFVFLAVSCATALNENLEEAGFALDQGDWNSAIAHSEAALNDDPSNTRAVLLLADAYAGRGGFQVLELLKNAADASQGRDLFDAIDKGIKLTITDTDDLRKAIIILLTGIEPVPTNEDKHYYDYKFHIGVLMAIEAFFLPAYAAQPLPDGPISVPNITEEIENIVEEDLLGADNALADAEFPDDNELMINVREIYCALKKASSSPTGFDLAALRDMILCHLSPEDGANLSSSDFESSINSCTDFDYTLCEKAGPTEP